MARLLRDETIVATWKEFFVNHCKSDIETIALSYPDIRSLLIDYWDIDKANPELAEQILNQPYKTIFNAEEALKDIDVSTLNEKLCIHFRVFNLPNTISIRDLRAKHAGKLIAVEGLVKRATYVMPAITISAFQCQKCGAVIKIEQEEDILKEPSECYEDQGGCGRISSFKLLTSHSLFIDNQKIELQENPDNLRGSEQPQKITILLEDDLVGRIFPGDRVQISGICHTMQRRQANFRLKTFYFAIDAIHIEINETAYEEIDITEEDEKEILKASKDPDIYNKMRQSIAPSIYGMEIEKGALTLQLFSGVPKIMPDGTKVRADIHVLLVGDPGTAKSQLLKYMHRLAPRSILASGSASTKAGLTATAVRDEKFSEGQWVLEAGALVLANNGFACIDEFDKMSEEDRGSMHQAMAQQEISIAKAGINATLKSKCSVLAAANPKQGRFDPFIPLHEQINMRPALISRFDLIFPILDESNREKDIALSAHILRTHKGSELAENISKCDKSEYSEEQRDSFMENIKPIYEPEFLRKYVAYAKRKIFPVMTDEALEIIQARYVDFRSNSKESIPFTPRQLEGYVRLAEASARVRLSNKATIDDAKRAISIVNKYLTRVGMDRETGKIDIDIIETGISHSQQKRMKTILGIIATLCESSESGAAIEDIIHKAEIEGIDSGRTEEAVKHMKERKELFVTPTGGYKINV